MEKIIHKVVVGSRLHGLYNETSDFDYRGIFINPLLEILSPFRKAKNVSWIEGDEDNTSYELADFCKFATKGNATILEILWSNQVIETSKWGEELVANRQKFLDSKWVYEAHKGYAESQYRKMNIFTPDARTPKFAVAYLRVLQQAKQLLQTGDFSPQVLEDRDFILDVKYNWRPELIPILCDRFARSQVALADVYAKNHDRYTPDIPWIEDFILRAYKEAE